MLLDTYECRENCYQYINTSRIQVALQLLRCYSIFISHDMQASIKQCSEAFAALDSTFNRAPILYCRRPCELLYLALLYFLLLCVLKMKMCSSQTLDIKCMMGL